MLRFDSRAGVGEDQSRLSALKVRQHRAVPLVKHEDKPDARRNESRINANNQSIKNEDKPGVRRNASQSKASNER